MFAKGDIFVYGTVGVCRVEDICVKECALQKREYYVLIPVYDRNSTVYVPVDSERLSSHAHPVMTKNEACDFIDNMSLDGFEWIINDKQRSDTFRSLIEEGSRLDLVKIIRTLYNRKAELAERGKKLRSTDDATMQRAEKLLYGELGWALGIEPGKVFDFIESRRKP